MSKPRRFVPRPRLSIPLILLGLVVAVSAVVLPRWPGSAGSETAQPSNPGPPSGERSKPNASNTGVPAGTTLTEATVASGSDMSGKTFDGQIFPPTFRVHGNDVTFKNSKFNGSVVIQGNNIAIEDSSITEIAISGAKDVTIRRANVGGFASDGIHVTSDTGRAQNILIEDSYVNSPNPGDCSHTDGLQVRGVDTLTVRGNNFDLGQWIVGSSSCPDLLYAAVFLENANGGNENVLVEGNWFNGGGTTAAITSGTNQRVINNRWGRDYRYTPLAESLTAISGVAQAHGNVWDDTGEPVPGANP